MTAYLLILVSYGKGSTPPFAAILTIYAVSLAFPFVLASSSRGTPASRADVLGASRGASLGVFVAAILGVALLFVGNWTNLIQTDSSVVIGVPVIFAGSTLLPYLASAKAIALNIVEPEGRGAVTSKSSLPSESFVILSLGLLIRSLPPRRILVRATNWILLMLVFPLAFGWLLLARTIGPAVWIFALAYYGLLVALTRRNVRQLGEANIEALRNSIRGAETMPGPSTASDLMFIIFITIIYVYLIIRLIMSPS